MASQERSLVDIASAWHLVASFLKPKDLVSCIQTCKQLKYLTDMEVVWKLVAQKAWHELADLDTGGYEAYKAMVLDDNRQNVVSAIALPGVCCNWPFHRPDLLFYQCRLLELQWWRSNNTLRLYFDARGESDLRHPLDSSIAVVTLKDAPAAAAPCDPAVQSDNVAYQDHHQEHDSDQQVSNEDQQYQYDQQQQQQSGGMVPDVNAGDPSNWSAVLDVFMPDQCHLLVDKEGHYKGVLAWSAEHCAEVLNLLFPSQQQQYSPEQQQMHQQQRQPPLPQHAHQQRGRRSEAFEEWADWQLSHDSLDDDRLDHHHDLDEFYDGDGHAAAAAAERHHSWSCHVGDLLGRMFCGSSSTSAGDDGSTKAGYSSSNAGVSAADHMTGRDCHASSAATAAPVVQHQPRRALVFCYANPLSKDLSKIQPFRGIPDYTIAVLAVTPLQQQSVAPSAPAAALCTDSADAPQVTAASATPVQLTVATAADAADADANDDEGSDLFSDQTETYWLDQQPLVIAGHGVERWQRLSSRYHLAANAGWLMKHERQWVAQWCDLPGAKLVRRGQLYADLQCESNEDELKRWADLPDAVLRRKQDWWV